MKKYVVEVVEKIVYKVECEAVSEERAEDFVRSFYDSGCLEGKGELDSVTFEVISEKEGE